MPQKLKLTVHGTGSDLLEIREVPDNLKIAKDTRFSLEAMAPAPAGLKYVWLTSKDKVLAVSEQDGPNGKVLVECLGAGISEMQLQIHPAELRIDIVFVDDRPGLLKRLLLADLVARAGGRGREWTVVRV